MTKEKRIVPDHGCGILSREGRPKGAKNKATIYKEKILATIENELLEDIPKFYRQLAETAMTPTKKKVDGEMTEIPPPAWAVRLYGELLLKPVMKSAEEDKGSTNTGIRIIVQGSNPKIEKDEPIEAEFEEIENG